MNAERKNLNMEQEWEDESWLNQDFNLGSLLKFTMPTILLMMFSSLYTAVDGYFVSNYVSEHAFASVNLVFPWTSAVIAVGLMLGAGGCAILSKQMGERDVESAGRNLSLLTVFTLVIGISLTVIGTLFTKQIVGFLGATPLLFDNASVYLRLLACFATPLLLQLASQMFFIADGRPYFGFGVGIIGGVTNMILDYLLIVKLDMGVAGAAIATGIGYSIPALTFLIYFLRKNKQGLRFKIPKWNGKVIIDACINGSSEMVTGLAGTITTFLFNIIILDLAGEMGVAAVGVIMYAQYLFQSAFLGFSQGVSPIISYNYGAQKPKRLRTVIKLSVMINLVAGIGVYLVTLLASDTVVGMYLAEGSEAFDFTKAGLILFALSFLPQGVNIFTSAMFTSLSDGRTSALISFLRTLVLIVAFVLIFPRIIGAYGVWLSVPFAEFISIFISLSCIYIKRKKYSY